jgi:hypothetical protein
MPRTCTVCRHPDRKEIDEALFQQMPVRELAKRYPGLSIFALNRHGRMHLMQMLAKAKEAEEIGNADAILSRLRRLEDRGWGLLQKAEAKEEFGAASQAMGQIRGCLELCAKLAGQIQESTVINIVNQPEWAIVQNVLMLALEEHPAARIAVAKALEDANAMNRAGYHA